MSTTDVPTEWLRTFVTVAELGTFQKAAGELGTDALSVGRQMRDLQELLGYTLFNMPLTQPVGLTMNGAIVLRYARDLLALHDKLLAGCRGNSLSS